MQQNQDTISSYNPNRRTARASSESIKKASRQVLLAAGVVLAIAGGSYITKSGNANSEKAKLRAQLMNKAEPTPFPHVVLEPYKVGRAPKDVMLSEVAADLHPLADKQDAMDEIQILRTYLRPEQQQDLILTPGQELMVAINTETGQILPMSEDIASVIEQS